MKRVCAILLLVAYTARAEGPVYDAVTPPPAVFSALVWRNGGASVLGYWYTEAQIQRINLRLNYLEDRCTRECIAATNEENKKLLGATPTIWIVGGAALLLGVAGGFYLGKRL